MAEFLLLKVKSFADINNEDVEGVERRFNTDAVTSYAPSEWGAGTEVREGYRSWYTDPGILPEDIDRSFRLRKSYKNSFSVVRVAHIESLFRTPADCGRFLFKGYRHWFFTEDTHQITTETINNILRVSVLFMPYAENAVCAMPQKDTSSWKFLEETAEFIENERRK